MEEIQQIPLAQEDVQDSISWIGDSKERYSAKNGYKIFWNATIETKFRESQDPIKIHSTLSRCKKIWRIIWKLKV